MCSITTVTVGGFQVCEYDIIALVGLSPGCLTLHGIDKSMLTSSGWLRTGL